jgi:hydroxyethylthiazole kinase-like uncharacterized protein yjeF
MTILAAPLLTRAESREVDATLARQGMSTLLLMENAGRGAAERIEAVARGRGIPRVDVLCGPGNNGGDGLVVARHLRTAGIDARAFALEDPSRWRGDAAVMRDALRATFADALVGTGAWDRDRGDALVVDALFGTGLTRALSDRAAEWVARCRGRRVVALDVPSGLDADTGSALGPEVIRAEQTLTFGTSKPGLHTGDGRALAGEVSVLSLGAPAPISTCGLWRVSAVTIAPRALDAHKGIAGRVLVVGGSEGMSGAGWLCALGAHRMGAGLVTLASRGLGSSSIPAVLETMTRALDADVTRVREQLLDAGRRADAVVIGPGLGTDAWASAALDAVCALDRPTVFDGDALNLLASAPGRALPSRSVLTPHPLEAARLRGSTEIAAIHADRVRAARSIAAERGALTVLKGAGTLVANPDGQVWVHPFAEPALAIAGSGDVLAGAIAARLADRERDPASWHEAALEGVFAHGRAGERLRARRGAARGGLASEIADALTLEPCNP